MRKFLLVLLSVVLGVSCALKKKDASERAQLHLKIGSSYFKNGKYPQALSAFLKARKLKPDDPTIHNNLALAYYVRDRMKKAEKHFEKAIDLKPDYTDAFNNLGRLHIEMGHYDEAIEELTTAVKDLTYRHPEKTHANLGYAYFRKGRYNKAKTHLKKALEINREHCMALHYHGRSLYKLKKYQQASTALDQAVQNCDKDKKSKASYYSGLSYLKLGEREQSVARMEKVLTLAPESSYAQKAKKVLDKLQ